MTNFSEQIRSRLNDRNLTVYGASHFLAAEADIDFKIANKRIERFLKRTPESVVQFQELVEALGGKVTIDWKD